MIELYQGDCLTLLPTLQAQSIDLVCADMPYGQTQARWDSVIPLEPLWVELKRVLKPKGCILFTAIQPFTTTLVISNRQWFRQSIVWDKVYTTGHLDANRRLMRRHEDIILFSPVGYYTYNPIMKPGKVHQVGGGTGSELYNDFLPDPMTKKDHYFPNTIISVSKASKKDQWHSTQKPIELMEYLIKTFSNEGETILDFCMGSGSTGIAAKNLNRQFVGMELDETFFNIARERINA